MEVWNQNKSKTKDCTLFGFIANMRNECHMQTNGLKPSMWKVLIAICLEYQHALQRRMGYCTRLLHLNTKYKFEWNVWSCCWIVCLEESVIQIRLSSDFFCVVVYSQIRRGLLPGLAEGMRITVDFLTYIESTIISGQTRQLQTKYS